MDQARATITTHFKGKTVIIFVVHTKIHLKKDDMKYRNRYYKDRIFLNKNKIYGRNIQKKI